MELSAFGIPLEPLRYIWLIAFIVYIGVMHSTRYHSPRNNQHGKGEGALHRPLRLPRQQCNEVCRTSFSGG